MTGAGGDAGPRLGPGGEFDRIRAFLEDLPRAAHVAVGPGDDAAVLAGGLVLSTDMTVEGIHFDSAWIGPEEVGWRAAAAALSDVAAMAAEPLGLLVSLAVPETGPGPEPYMKGVRALADEMGTALLGGDLTRSPGPVVIDVAVAGRADRPLLRSGARPGDELWVTGTLGGAAGAVAAWRRGASPSPALRRAFARPRPRIAEARWLHEAGDVRAGLDVSDGIAGDAGHLAAASGVRVVLEAGRIPVDPGLPGRAAPGADEPLELALHGGEDFELLVAAPPGRLAPRVEEFRLRFDLSLMCVGTVESGEGVWLLPGEGEEARPLARGGWDHFERTSTMKNEPRGGGRRR